MYICIYLAGLTGSNTTEVFNLTVLCHIRVIVIELDLIFDLTD